MKRANSIIQESTLAQVQSCIQLAMDAAKLNRNQLAKKLGCSRSLITRFLNGEYNMTVRTFARVIEVCGYDVHLQVQPATRRQGLGKG